MRILKKSHAVLALLLLPWPIGAQTATEIVLPEGTRISLALNDDLSTKQNHQGDPFTATVTNPVYLRERVIIPKGSTVAGSVCRILRPGRFNGKAQMNLMFSSIRLADSSKELPITASLAPPPDKEGNTKPQGEGTLTADGSKGKDVAKVAAPTISGAGLGGIVGGGKGAAIGAGVGAAVGLASILAGRGKDLELRRGAAIDIQLDVPLTIPASEVVRRDNLSPILKN